MPTFDTAMLRHLAPPTCACAFIPSTVTAFCVVLCASYLVGSVSWAFVIGKLKGVDIRKEGSGNLGATNVTRVLGKPWGVLCFFLDFLKGLLPALAARFLAAPLGLSGGAADCLLLAAVAGALTGHIWSVFLRFKGGKGVATGGGALAAVAPLAVLIAIIIWVVIFKTSRYVSLASIIAVFFLPVAALGLSHLGVWPLSPILLSLLTLASLLSIIKHRSNIVRLLNGTENRFTAEKKA